MNSTDKKMVCVADPWCARWSSIAGLRYGCRNAHHGNADGYPLEYIASPIPIIIVIISPISTMAVIVVPELTPYLPAGFAFFTPNLPISLSYLATGAFSSIATLEFAPCLALLPAYLAYSLPHLLARLPASPINRQLDERE